MTSEPARPITRTTYRWLWVCALVTTIFVASGQGEVAAPAIIDFDKFAHFSIFGLLATLVARTMPNSRRRWWAILIVSFYGASDEFRQSLTPGRSVEFADWLADTCGAIFAVTIYQCWPAYHRLLECRLFVRRQRPSALESEPVIPEISPSR